MKFEEYEPPDPLAGPIQCLQWLVSFRSPFKVWETNWLLFIIEWGCTATLPILLFLARRRDAVILHYAIIASVAGILLDLGLAMIPPLRYWWQEHPTISLVGCRFPFYMISAYFDIYYLAFAVARKMRLPTLGEACLSSIAVSFILFTVDSFCGLHLLWTWHDTDPVYVDKFYSIPWTEFCLNSLVFFHAVFIYSLFADQKCKTLAKNAMSGKPVSYSLLIFMGLLAAVFMLLEYAIIYRFLCATFGLPTSYCYIAIMCLCISGVWITDRRTICNAAPRRFFTIPKDIFFYMTAAPLALAPLLCLFAQPEYVRAIGPHQPIGPCNETTSGLSFSLMVNERVTHLCVDNPSLQFYNFDCLSNEELELLVNRKSSWYPICGKPLEDRAGYTFKISMVAIVGILLVYQVFTANERTSFTISDIQNSRKQR